MFQHLSDLWLYGCCPLLMPRASFLDHCRCISMTLFSKQAVLHTRQCLTTRGATPC